MRYTYTCTSCGAIAHTTRAADLRNRSGRRCQDCKDGQSPGERTVAAGGQIPEGRERVPVPDVGVVDHG